MSAESAGREVRGERGKAESVEEKKRGREEEKRRDRARCIRCLAAERRCDGKNGDGGRCRDKRERDRREEGKNAFVDCSIE